MTFPVMDLRPLLELLEARADTLVEDVRTLVTLESPTGDVDRMRQIGDVLAAWWQAIGARVERRPVGAAGANLVARWGQPGERPVLVVGHMDTVHDVGMLQRNPLRVEEGRLYGPGTQDMKAGLVMAYHAVRALRDLAVAPARPITMLITVDEETGSVASAPLIERLARESSHALVLEAAGPAGEAKTARKGVALYELTVTGRAAHAGIDFAAGRSAVVALSRLVPGIAALSDLGVGTTVNVGVLRGGTRANVVAEAAHAQVDVRFFEPVEADRVERALRDLRTDDGTSITVVGGVNRTALRRTDDVAVLYERARAIGRALGLGVGEIAVGGASDGNITAAVGCPTLDGLGAVGAGLHTPHEYIDVASLPARTALLAGLLASV